MNRFSHRDSLLPAGGALALLSVLAASATAQSNDVANFQSGPGGWTHPFGGVFPAVQGSALPVRQDPDFVRAGVSWRIGDLANPNLKPWVKDVMKKDNDEIDRGQDPVHGALVLPAGGHSGVHAAGGPFVILQTAHEN